MEKTSKYSYGETLERLSAAIVAAGNTLFATLDQAAAARDVGLELRPTSLLIFGNPRGGTGLMQAFPAFGLELPLKILVWEEDGTVRLAYSHMAEIAQRYGVAGKDALLAAMDRALDTLSDSVAKE
jgi:uncharacterized protein (DUF302 family)